MQFNIVPGTKQKNVIIIYFSATEFKNVRMHIEYFSKLEANSNIKN